MNYEQSVNDPSKITPNAHPCWWVGYEDLKTLISPTLTHQHHQLKKTCSNLRPLLCGAKPPTNNELQLSRYNNANKQIASAHRNRRYLRISDDWVVRLRIIPPRALRGSPTDAFDVWWYGLSRRSGVHAEFRTRIPYHKRIGPLVLLYR